eukprot:264113_1
MTSVRFRNPDNPDKPDAIPVRSPERESIELPVKPRAPRFTHTAHSPLTTSVYDALTDSDPGTPPPTLRPGISRHRFPVRTGLMAVFLLLVGIVFGVASLVVGYEYSFRDAIPYLIMGFIGFVPGSYHSVILLRAWLGHVGYSYDMVPSFD